MLSSILGTPVGGHSSDSHVEAIFISSRSLAANLKVCLAVRSGERAYTTSLLSDKENVSLGDDVNICSDDT